jgi:hypothetical protein
MDRECDDYEEYDEYNDYNEDNYYEDEREIYHVD